MTVPYNPHSHSWVTTTTNSSWEKAVVESLEKILKVLERLASAAEPVKIEPEWGPTHEQADKGESDEFVVTIGRIVHYRSYGTPNQEYVPECRAAMITRVHKDEAWDTVDLAVMNPEGMFFKQGVARSRGAVGGTWHPGCGV